jgi:hypothetical protein
MSLATFKKKTQTKYNNNSVSQGPQGFSLNGVHRSQGWVGQDLRGRTLVRTLNRGGANRGHGGYCGGYPNKLVIPSEIQTTENTNYVKSSSINTLGYLHEHYPWIYGGSQGVWKPDDNHGVGDQGSYLQHLNQQTIACIDNNFVDGHVDNHNYENVICPQAFYRNTNYNDIRVSKENHTINYTKPLDSGMYTLNFKSACYHIDADKNFGASRRSCSQCAIR